MTAPDFTYVPHEDLCESSPLKGFGGICGPCLACWASLVGAVRRWWHTTTDRTFLTCSASRRDSWKVLLPVPGILAMLVDSSTTSLVILDAYATGALLLVGYLPPGMLCSDLVISLVYAAFYSAHSFLLLRERHPLAESDFELLDSLSCQVLSTFAMAFAGVHSVALAGFSAVVATVSYSLRYDYTWAQAVVCLYIIAAAAFAERRLAQLVCERCGPGFSYKALTAVPELQEYQSSSSIHQAGRCLSRGRSGERSQGEPSQHSLADGARSLILSHSPPLAASTPAPLGEKSVAAAPRQRFSAAQVQMPGAATHEAPNFLEPLELIHGQGMSDSGYSRHSQTSPSTAKSADLKPSPWSGGIECGDSARFAEMLHPPVSPPSLDDTVVLRGIKMHGFHCHQLNTLFIESVDPTYQVNGRETYWTEARDYLLYYSEATSTWGASKARRFRSIVEGASNGVAHSPEGFEIWPSGAQSRRAAPHPVGNWREWESKAAKWVARPNSGVASRGKVRPKAPPLEKAVQTELRCEDRASQTEAPQPQDRTQPPRDDF